jgi:hypothetical protein
MEFPEPLLYTHSNIKGVLSSQYVETTQVMEPIELHIFIAFVNP